jgi:hypothetical protein
VTAIIILVSVVATATLIVVLRVAVVRAGRRGSERALLGREIRVAERQLHNITSEAFLAMLDVAHDNPPSGSCDGHR